MFFKTVAVVSAPAMMARTEFMAINGKDDSCESAWDAAIWIQHSVKHDRSRHRNLVPNGKKDPSDLALDDIESSPVGNQTTQRHALVLRNRGSGAARVKTMGRLRTDKHSWGSGERMITKNGID